MLQDPLAIFTGAAGITTYTGGTAASFDRIDPTKGLYVGNGIGTTDQPQFFQVSNRMNYDGVSTMTLKSWQQINVAAINGIPQKDDVITASLQLWYPHRSGTTAMMVDHILRLTNAAMPAGYLNKLLLGNR
jgi:hypothetical protein